MDFITQNAIKSLGFAAVQGAVSAAVAFLLISRRKRLCALDKVALFWLAYSGVVHFTLEAAFLYLSLTGKVVETEGLFADIWKEYAKADARWGVSDPTIVSLEAWTVPLNGTLTFVLMHAIMNNRPYRHFVQVFLNVCELYGGWMTFCPEWISGNVNLDVSNPLFLWVYLVFFNGLWVVFPVLLLWQSLQSISTNAAAVAPKAKGKKQH